MLSRTKAFARNDRTAVDLIRTATMRIMLRPLIATSSP